MQLHFWSVSCCFLDMSECSASIKDVLQFPLDIQADASRLVLSELCIFLIHQDLSLPSFFFAYSSSMAFGLLLRIQDLYGVRTN